MKRTFTKYPSNYVKAAKEIGQTPLLDNSFFEPLMGEFWDSHIVTASQIDHYYVKIPNLNILKGNRCNWHDDYWGYGDEYKERAIEIYKALKPFYNRTISIELPADYSRKEPEIITGKLLYIAVDYQYNSHVEVVLDSFN